MQVCPDSHARRAVVVGHAQATSCLTRRSGEALDVPTEGLTGLLTIVLGVPWVPRVLVSALEVSHKDLF